MVPMFTPGNHQCLEEEAAEERESGAHIISANANDLACTGFYRGHEGYDAMARTMKRLFCKFCGSIVIYMALCMYPYVVPPRRSEHQPAGTL